MTIFEELRADHDLQRRWLDDALATSGESDERSTAIANLAMELQAHAVAEERFFYKQLIDDSSGIEKARHSIAEHKELDDLLAEVRETEMSSPQWLARLKDLAHKVRHHLEEEEHEVFQVAGKALTEAQKTELAESYRAEMREQRAQFTVPN